MRTCGAGQEEPGVLNLQGLQGISVDSAHFRSVQSLKRLIPLSGKQNIGEILEHRFVHTGLSDPTENNEPHIGGKAQSRLPRDSHDIRGIIHHSYLCVIAVSNPSPLVACCTYFCPCTYVQLRYTDNTLFAFQEWRSNFTCAPPHVSRSRCRKPMQMGCRRF